MSPLSPRHLAGASAPTERYEVGDVVASGGMGIVRRAFDRLGQRWVAYKRLRPFELPRRSRMIANFQREYDTLRRLTHPNIVEAYDYGLTAEGPYYTMELLQGQDLASISPLPLTEACRVLRDVASALALLEARRLVHRDLSPRNVFLAHDGRAKLIDFGALSCFGPAGDAVGTVPFMAPESVLGEPIDHRTDLYSLGALAYFLLTGRTHVQVRRMEELPDAWQKRLRRPSDQVAGLPDALDELVLALLAAAPSARPSSAAHIIEQLSAIAPLPPEDNERVARCYLRHPPLVGREGVLSTLEEALQAARRGRGGCVVLEGEQGMGRSALLDALAVNAQVAGANVLRAAGARRGAPFRTARELAHAGAALFGDALPDLEAPELGVEAADPRRSGVMARTPIEASERYAAMVDTLTRSIWSWSERAPLVLLIDDAQDLDPESLTFLAALSDTLELRSVLLVLGLQKGEVCDEPKAWARLSACAVRQQLEPLNEGELSRLVEVLLGDAPNAGALSAWLLLQTGGNPAHCMDLTQLLIAQGAIRYARGSFMIAYELGPSAPDVHHRALLSRLSRVSQEARELALLLALHPDALHVEQLVDAHAGEHARVVQALSELAQRGVVIAREEHYACASELLRAALLSTLSPAQARCLHAALGRALTPASSSSLDAACAAAEHLLRAGRAEQLNAAWMLARWAETHVFELGMQRRRAPTLEAALSVLGAEGHSDHACIALLVTLCMNGFYGDLSVLDRYLERTLRALTHLCGLDLAAQLGPRLGARLALALGLSAGFARQLRVHGRRARRTFLRHFEALAMVTGTATGSAAHAFDAPRATRIAAWLAPLAAAPPNTPLFLMREFCVGTTELVAGRLQAAARRYRFVLDAYDRPMPGIGPWHVKQIRAGCLIGIAQALVSDLSAGALEFAERTDQEGAAAFFAPHAESVRATYFAYRGDSDAALRHRQRCELLSLRNGISWSALSVMAVRLTLPSALNGDAVGLSRAIADLEQVAKLSPSLALLHELAQAHLDYVRGRLEPALARYQRVFSGEAARALPTYAGERSVQVLALCAAERFAEATALGQSVLAELLESADGELNQLLFCVASAALARAEIGLGQLRSAAQRLEDCLARPPSQESPALAGNLHRERALVAAAERDSAAFERHYAGMVRGFRATRNPLLMQQCAALEVHARNLGLSHEALAAAGAEEDLSELMTVIERPHSLSR